MNSLNFICAKELTDIYLLQVVRLLFEAEYSCSTKINELWNEVYNTKHDKLNIIEPYLCYTYVLMNNNEVIGFFTVTTKKQTKEMEGKIPSWNKNDPELISCVNFYMYEATNEDFILHYIAIDSIYRGCGFFKRLNSYLVELARKNYCKRIVFVVRQSNPAFQIYKYYGARILGEITNIDTGLNEKLIKSYFTI